jgi:hypothetical protein
MNKEFVPYEEALALKELRFDEPCFGYYLEDGTWVPASYSIESTVYPSNSDLLSEWCSAPLYQQAFRWFRENHFLNYKIFRDGGYWICVVNSFKDEDYSSPEDKANTYGLGVFDTYPEAELACLRKLIEIVKK